MGGMRPLCLVLAMLAVGVMGCAAASPSPVTVVEVEPPRPPPPPAPPPAAAASAPGDHVEAGDGELVTMFMKRQDAVPDTRRVHGAGFHHEVPAGWEDLDPATLGSPLIRCAQRNTLAVDGFMTNVNIATEPFVGDGPAYADANLIELRKVSTIRDQRAARAGDRPASDIEAYWPNPGGVPYVTLQRYATDGTDGFVITCSIAASAFDRDRPLCTRILDTFRVE